MSTKWAKLNRDFDFHTGKGKGQPVLAFKKSNEAHPAVPVTQPALEAIIAAGAGEEVSAPADRRTDKAGGVVVRDVRAEG